jgi:2-polyprenyl-3-methyl-5-hydroxy-6-metoxy-1,4-benzoquinol methylase
VEWWRSRHPTFHTSDLQPHNLSIPDLSIKLFAMTAATSQHEYAYIDGDAQHHHAYILKPILDFLGHSQSASKLKTYHILDLGCGNGSLSRYLAQQGHTVVGVEPSTSGIQFAQAEESNCTFIQAEIETLPYETLAGQFDVVISSEVIEHLLFPRELISASKRCLKPGGRLILTTPYHGYWKNLAIALMGKMDQHFNPLWDGGHVKFFSPKTLKQLMEQEGLSKIQFKFAGRYPLLWKSMISSGVMP